MMRMHGFAGSNSLYLRSGRRARRSGSGRPCTSARLGPLKSRHGRVFALAVPLMLLLLAASASAAAATCVGGQFLVLHDRTLVFPAAPCTGGNGTLTLTPMTPPAHGQLSFAPGGVPQYMPSAGFVGADSFTYKATDQTPAASNTATVTITVTDQAPTCNDTSTTTT